MVGAKEQKHEKEQEIRGWWPIIVMGRCKINCSFHCGKLDVEGGDPAQNLTVLNYNALLC